MSNRSIPTGLLWLFHIEIWNDGSFFCEFSPSHFVSFLQPVLSGPPASPPPSSHSLPPSSIVLFNFLPATIFRHFLFPPCPDTFANGEPKLNKYIWLLSRQVPSIMLYHLMTIRMYIGTNHIYMWEVISKARKLTSTNRQIPAQRPRFT